MTEYYNIVLNVPHGEWPYFEMQSLLCKLFLDKWNLFLLRKDMSFQSSRKSNECVSAVISISKNMYTYADIVIIIVY